MPSATPMRLLRVPEPFDHFHFVYEPKPDGFRALADIRGHHCELMSHNGHTFKQWPQLAEEIAHSVRVHSAVPDGEICLVEPEGNLKNLFSRPGMAVPHGLRPLAVHGDDLRAFALLQRKRAHKAHHTGIESGLRFMEHIARRRVDLFCASATLKAVWRSMRTACIAVTAARGPG